MSGAIMLTGESALTEGEKWAQEVQRLQPNQVTSVHYDEVGHITAVGISNQEAVDRLIGFGERICVGDVGFSMTRGIDPTKWVDITQDPPAVVLRPDWTLNWPETVAVGVELAIPDVPPCVIRFTGPVRGEQHHPEAGTAEIGWGIPGLYTVHFDTWPHVDKTVTIEVTA